MLNPQIYIVIAVAVAVIVGFLSGKVHYALVGIFGLVSLQVTGVLTAEQAWSGFSNTSVVMFASMFVLSAAFRKTSFLFKVQQKLINAKGGERTLVATCLIVAFVFGFFLSATAAAAALVPIAVSIADGSGKSRPRLLKATADGCNLGVETVPIGLSASFYMEYNAYLAACGGQQRFEIWTLMACKLPISIIVLAYIIIFGYKLMPEKIKDVAGEVTRHDITIWYWHLHLECVKLCMSFIDKTSFCFWCGWRTCFHFSKRRFLVILRFLFSPA